MAPALKRDLTCQPEQTKLVVDDDIFLMTSSIESIIEWPKLSEYKITTIVVLYCIGFRCRIKKALEAQKPKRLPRLVFLHARVQLWR